MACPDQKTEIPSRGEGRQGHSGLRPAGCLQAQPRRRLRGVGREGEALCPKSRTGPESLCSGPRWTSGRLCDTGMLLHLCSKVCTAGWLQRGSALSKRTWHRGGAQQTRTLSFLSFSFSSLPPFLPSFSLPLSLPVFIFSFSTPFLETSLQRLCRPLVLLTRWIPMPCRTPHGESTPSHLQWVLGGWRDALGAPPRCSAQPQRPPSSRARKRDRKSTRLNSSH